MNEPTPIRGLENPAATQIDGLAGRYGEGSYPAADVGNMITFHVVNGPKP